MPPVRLSRPPLLKTAAELRMPVQTASQWLTRFPSVLAAPRGDKRPIMLVPGYMAGDGYMRPLALYLHALGYRARGWGLGRNQGDVDHYVPLVAERLADLMRERPQDSAYTLVGWSLGGCIAREVARLAPDTVREVITFGTPLSGGPKYTAPGRIYANRKGIDLDLFEEDIHQRNSQGLKQPLTAIYSRGDGIVEWRASLDYYNRHTRHVQVRGTHLGLGYNPAVWRIIAERLAANPLR